MLADRKEFVSVDLMCNEIVIDIEDSYVKTDKENQETEEAETESFTQNM